MAWWVVEPMSLQLQWSNAVFLMLELEDAVEQIVAAVPPARAEAIPLREAHGRIVFQEIRSPMDLPPFDNSAMDGYAVRSQDIDGATQQTPAGLRVVGTVAAGDTFQGGVTAGCCVRLFTGSALPNGADCVVMQEDTRLDKQHSDRVLVLDKARPWENIRLKGDCPQSGPY